MTATTSTWHGTHQKFVGWVDAIGADSWTQRVVSGSMGDWEGWIDWGDEVSLPEGAGQGHYVSVHRTKAGDWYAVNLSRRMPRLTESQVKRAEAKARRWMGLVDPESRATNGSRETR